MPEKAIFFDRDGTLIEDPGYLNNPDQVKLLPAVGEALTELKALGYKLVVVSNQSGVARGIVSEKVLGEIHDRLTQLLETSGAPLDRIYYCPYHPDGVIPKYRKESDCRKPNPGMLLTAAEEIDIDLSRSWMIGNSGRDIEAGSQAGCKTILINSPFNYNQFKLGRPVPDYKAVNIKEVVNIIKKYHRSHHEPVSAEKAHSAPKSQTTEELHQPGPAKTETALPEQNNSGDRYEQLLCGILEQLKSTQRADMFGEFSIMRLMAGIVQIIVLFCLLVSIWFLISPTMQENRVLISLGFAMVFQLMSLTFYIMQDRK